MTDETAKKKELIQGKVAAVVNERELAINVGKKSGVRVGMKFKVLTDNPTEIRDPETNDVLGYIDREKVRVKAVDVQESFSICRTYEIYIIGGQWHNLMNATDMFAPPREEPETLEADSSALIPPVATQERYIKKGDRVVQIFND